MLQRARSRNAEAEKYRNRLCSTRLWRLQILAKPQDPRDKTDRHEEMRALSDQQISSMCVGTDLPVSTSDADDCWVFTGKATCYDKALSQLHDVYQAHRDAWSYAAE